MRQLLRPLEFLQTHGLQRTGFDSRVIDDHDAAGGADAVDSHQEACPGNGILGVWNIHQIACQTRELQERSTGIQLESQPLAR